MVKIWKKSGKYHKKQNQAFSQKVSRLFYNRRKCMIRDFEKTYMPSPGLFLILKLRPKI